MIKKIFMVTAAIGTAISVSACRPERLNQSDIKTGTVGRDGGDVIFCRTSSENGFHGDYALDFVLTHDNARHPNFETADEYLDRVESILAEKLPALGISFSQFRRTIMINDNANARVWLPTNQVQLSELHSDRGSNFFDPPANCKDETGRYLVKQLIRREVLQVENFGKRKIFYHYDAMTLESLKQFRPLQFSYMMVHEWLWDFVRHEWINRKINHLLQTDALQNLNIKQLLRFLASMGISVDDRRDHVHEDAEEALLASEFAASPLCDVRNRAVYQLSPLEPRIKLDLGQTRTFEIKLTDKEANQNFCGIALLFDVKGRRGSSILSTRVARGPLSVPSDQEGFQLTNTDKTQPAAYFGVCKDWSCILRSGELAELITGNNLYGSQWQLTVSALQGNLQLINPRLLLVGQKQDSP